ncbi:hypothetical protein [Georgenia sp. SUBG003]|uniref:hypothetical protein n=1 Tax=Georgenia sp. SUBG003 TaxID=1497974 RepID=UPI0004DB2108|nr:hypothetical protein DA06_02565 [Georgenia sp. SUBG003]
MARWSRTLAVTHAARIHATFRAEGRAGSERAALVTFTFRDAAGGVVLPAGDLPMHPVLGAYHYLEQGVGAPAVTDVQLDVPPEACALTVEGVQWKKAEPVHLAGEPDLAVGPAAAPAASAVAEYVRSIPADASVVVLDTTAPALGHKTLSLRPNRLALEYAAAGWWVIFFPFGSLQDNDSHVSERVRQFPRSEFTAFLDAAVERRGHHNVYVCSSFPGLHAVAAVDTLRAAGWTAVYEVRDDMEEFNRVGYSSWYRPELEARVAGRADHVVTVSPRLARKMDVLTRSQDRRAVVVPNAVASELVVRAAALRTPEAMARRESTRKVGYVGHLTASWFDWPLLTRWAERNPGVEVEIVGHGIPEDLALPDNVAYLGPRSHAELLDVVGEWKVGLIPFLPSPLTSAVDPNKLYEYLALGLRTVTAEMGAVRSAPATWVYRGAEEFDGCVAAALADTADKSATVEAYLATATWQARAATMIQTWGSRG